MYKIVKTQYEKIYTEKKSELCQKRNRSQKSRSTETETEKDYAIQNNGRYKERNTQLMISRQHIQRWR